MCLFSEPQERTEMMLKRYTLIRNLMERSQFYVFEHEKNKLARLTVTDSNFNQYEQYGQNYVKLHEIGS